MLRHASYSARLIALTIALCVIAYTGLILTSAAILSPKKRLGSLVYGQDGQPIGSLLIAQAFTQPEYLWPRPSAVDYNASAAGGSNLTPTNLKIRLRAEQILGRYALPTGSTLPADLVTTSGSGLDPHITLQAALLQADRIAAARRVNTAAIHEKMQTFSSRKASRLLYTDGLINVLEFNLLLDAELKWSKQ
jgi:potassium-transporting ATPase KdpC subunit